MLRAMSPRGWYDGPWDERQMASGGEENFKRGMTRKEEGHYRAAHNDLRKAVEVAPEHAEAWSELGWLTYGLGMGLDEAERCLERAIRLDPHLGMAQLYLGVVLHRQDEKEAAEARFRLALGLVEDIALVHAVFAEEFLWRNSRYGEAEQHFRAALSIDPDLVLALRDYARMLACHGRDAEAKELFSRALRADPTDMHTKEAYGEFLAELVADDRDPDECLREAIKKDPQYTCGIQCLQERSSRRGMP